jgi:hypothetical protein
LRKSKVGGWPAEQKPNTATRDNRKPPQVDLGIRALDTRLDRIVAVKVRPTYPANQRKTGPNLWARFVARDGRGLTNGIDTTSVFSPATRDAVL